jgi:gamma-glutamyltranspeptidase/glutathione hydrolase
MVRLLLLALALASPARAAAPRFMVIAADPAAAEAGAAMLRAGGTAIDAAIAAQLVLGLVEPQSSGLGGGAVMLHYQAATQQVTSWDGRETAPAAATPDLFLKPDGQKLPFADAVLSGRSVGVPGAIKMLEAAYKASGKLPWADLFAPAIKLAEDGFAVSPRLAAQIAADASHIERQAAARSYFLQADGTPLQAGTVLANPAYASALRAIAAGGANALLRGPIAAEIATAVRADPNPGLMTTDDLTAYDAKQRPPVCGAYREQTVCTMGPPSTGGPALLQALGMLGHFDLTPLDPAGVDAAQLVLDAERLAAADRSRFGGDADFVTVPLDGLLSPDYLAARARLITPGHAIADPQPGNIEPTQSSAPMQPEHGTSNVIVIDPEGNAVCLTTTIEGIFGSGLMVHGFLLNNQLTDFSFQPEIDGRPVANRVQPGKRPASAMSPSFVLAPDGKLLAVAGSAGGGRIIGYVLQSIIGVLDWHMDPVQDLAQPHVGSLGIQAEVEEGTGAASLAHALEARGEHTRIAEMASGSSLAVATPAGWIGASDPRRKGAAITE